MTHYCDKLEIWRKCGNIAPKTVKIWNFAHKFAYQGPLVFTVYEILSVYTPL